jgi:hypothetical protein
MDKPEFRLEEHVASVYRALGYEVLRDQLIRGNQVDIYATRKWPGYGDVRLVVEVKYKSKGAVPKAQVHEYYAVARTMLENFDCTRVVMVCNIPFSRFTKQAISGLSNFDVQSLADLERQLLHLEAPLEAYLARYKGDPIGARYIDLSASLLESRPKGLGGPQRTSAMKLLELAESKPDIAIIVFADYGAGKTTLLERIKASVAQAWLERTTDRIPILFQLRDYPSSGDIDQFITYTFNREFGVTIPVMAFWDLVGQSKFFILLDGFDEISIRADKKKRAELLRQLSPLMFGQSPAMMTSRPSYFANLQEYAAAIHMIRTAAGLRLDAAAGNPPALPPAQVLADKLRPRYNRSGPKAPRDARFISFRLDPVTSGQIDLFLQTFEADFRQIGIGSCREVRTFIDGVYDLSDLIQRPILLDMVVATILGGDIDIANQSVPIGPSNLYEAYTGAKLRADWDKGPSHQQSLSPEKRQAFAEACAWEMHKRGVLELERVGIERAASAALGGGSAVSEDQLTDFRTCSFLTIGAQGTLRFVHKSFYEFFVARRLRAMVQREELQGLSRDLPPEIQYFLGGFAFSDAQFYAQLTELAVSAQAGGHRGRPLGQARGNVLSNLCAALLHAHPGLVDGRLSGVSIRGLRARQLELHRCKLEDITLTDVGFELMNLVDCKADLHVSGSRFSELVVRGGETLLDIEAPLRLATLDEGVLNLKIAGRKIRYPLSVNVAASELKLKAGSMRAVVTVKCKSSFVDVTSRQPATSLEGVASYIDCRDLITDDMVVDLDGSCVYLRRPLGRLAIRARESALIVAPGLRSPSSVSQPEFGADLLDFRAKGVERSVVIAHPSVNIEGLGDLGELSVVVGGHLGANTEAILLSCSGVVFSLRPVSVSEAAGRPPNDSRLYPTVEKGRMLVLRGTGNSLSRAMEAVGTVVNRLVRQASPGTPTNIVESVEAALSRSGLDPAGLEGVFSHMHSRLVELWPLLSRMKSPVGR